MELDKIETVFREFFAAHRSHYGIRITSAALDFSKIYVDFTLLAGHSYCCSEPGCHLPWNCKKLIAIALAHALPMPDEITVYWPGIVQAGAKLETLKGLGIPPESNANEWDATLDQNGLKVH
jgi:alkylhydroperoxidase/carboxymuconolactone decarboxylase family protein YurZ